MASVQITCINELPRNDTHKGIMQCRNRSRFPSVRSGAVRASSTVIVLLGVVFVAVLAGGCTSKEQKAAKAEAAAKAAAQSAQTALISAKQDLVRRELKDPSSAQFRLYSTAVGTLENGKINEVNCGYVNAKNSFGGYVGERPWYVYRIWDGSTGVCLSTADECDFRFLAVQDEAKACVASLGP